MKIPEFQKKRLINTYEPNTFVLVYDTGETDVVEMLENKVNNINYPITCSTNSIAKQRLLDFNQERFLNLRAVWANDLFD